MARGCISSQYCLDISPVSQSKAPCSKIPTSEGRLMASRQARRLQQSIRVREGSQGRCAIRGSRIWSSGLTVLARLVFIHQSCRVFDRGALTIGFGA